MRKRVYAAMLLLIMLGCLIGPSAYAEGPAGPTLTVTASVSQASPGDEITYTITMGQVSDLFTIQMVLDIPKGLTYIPGSGTLVDGLKEKLGFDTVDWSETTRMLNGYSDSIYNTLPLRGMMLF